MVSVLETARAAADTATPARTPRWLTILAVAATAGLLWLGTGLDPIPALTWLAPLPLFVLAGRVPGWHAALAALPAWLLGGLNMLTYYVGDLHVPVPVTLGVLLVQAAIFAGAVALFRIGGPLAAAATWASGEYLFSLVSPGGAFTSLAYTQAEVLPVIQLTSLTGVWGVSFLLIAVPAALASLRRSTVALVCVLGVLTLGYGSWRLLQPAPAETVRIGLVDVRQPEDSIPLSTPRGRELLQAYLDRIPTGVSVVVLPEKTLKVTEAELAAVREQLSRRGLTVVIGLTLKDGSGVHNVAMAYTADGVVRYDKQHLVPGWEDHFTPGDKTVVLPGTALGLAICKDLDYPPTTVDSVRAGAGVLLVPALDVDRDGWLHSRIALVRGVETGTAIVRSSDHGLLTASDGRGRILGEAAATGPATQLTVDVPVSAGGTVYSRLGDWFAWLCLLLLAGLLLRSWVQRRS